MNTPNHPRAATEAEERDRHLKALRAMRAEKALKDVQQVFAGVPADGGDVEALDDAIAALEREGELREALQHARVHSEDHSQRQNEEARCYRVVLAFDDPADAAAFLEARAALGGGNG